MRDRFWRWEGCEKYFAMACPMALLLLVSVPRDSTGGQGVSVARCFGERAAGWARRPYEISNSRPAREDAYRQHSAQRHTGDDAVMPLQRPPVDREPAVYCISTIEAFARAEGRGPPPYPVMRYLARRPVEHGRPDQGAEQGWNFADGREPLHHDCDRVSSRRCGAGSPSYQVHPRDEAGMGLFVRAAPPRGAQPDERLALFGVARGIFLRAWTLERALGPAGTFLGHRMSGCCACEENAGADQDDEPCTGWPAPISARQLQQWLLFGLRRELKPSLDDQLALPVKRDDRIAVGKVRAACVSFRALT